MVNNSQELQKRHPAVYEELFSRCPLVLSTPAKFFWSGEYSVLVGAPFIGQNIPLRSYVGIEQLSGQGKIEIVGAMYVPSRDHFSNQMDPIHRRKLTTFLQSVLVKYQGETFPSIRIHSVSEISPGSGLGLSGSFGATLAAATLFHVGKMTAADLQDWSKMPTYRLPQLLSFDRVMRLAWKIASLLHDGISSGASSFFSLVGSVYPILYYTERRGGATALPPDVRVPMDIGEHFHLLDRLFYGGIRLDELLHLKDTPSWPVDFFLIYSGNRGGGRTAHSFREIDEELSDITEFVKKSFEYLKADPSIFSPVFYQLCMTEGWEGLHGNFFSTNGVLSLTMLYALNELFSFGGSDQSVAKLASVMSAIHESQRILGRSTPHLERMSTVIHDSMGLAYAGHLGVKITGSGRGGDLLVVTPTTGTFAAVKKTVAALQESMQGTIWLDYASPRDGFEERGLVLEQSLEDNIYSSFVSSGCVILDLYGPKGKTILTLTPDEFEEKQSSFPLLLDTTTKDIFIRGRQLTSKDLKSAKTTVALFLLLLEKLGQSLGKADLPVSSYTIDRNELQSKIIGPLQAVVEKTLRRPLPLSLQGPLRLYTLTLNQPPFEIAVLKKRV